MPRRSPEFEVADMLAAGPRDVMVPSRAHDAAREVLLQAEIVTDDRAVVAPPTRWRLPTSALRKPLEVIRIYPPAGSLSEKVHASATRQQSKRLSGRQPVAMRVG